MYTRHGGSAELALPTALKKTKTSQREGEKENHLPVFTVASLPRRVRAARQDLRAYNWFNQGSGESRIRQRTMDTHRKTTKSLREVYFKF